MKRIVLLAGVFAAGCVSAPTPGALMNRAINKTVDSAATKVGESVGQAIAADLLANNPNLLYSYQMGLFQAMFYQGGYHMGTDDYAEGQFTKWTSSGSEHGEKFGKTLLKQHDNGNQWWRVESETRTSDGELAPIVTEALFSKEDSTGGRRVLRMRSQLPGEAEPREIPITTEDSQRWRMHPRTALTPESMEGMTVGVEKIEVPAGTFQAKHLQTRGADQAEMNWWVADEVPGKVVKFTRVATDGKSIYEVTLVEVGEGASESKLGVDLTQGAGAAEPQGSEDS